jgi:uncharacterized OB-fold protein
MPARNVRIHAYRCRDGTLYLHPHHSCPACGGRLVRVRIDPRARLVSHTTVRVNPSGEPLRLGVAVTDAGAATLCIVEGSLRGHGRDRVRLVLRDGRYHALAAGARLTRSGARRATGGGPPETPARSG